MSLPDEVAARADLRRQFGTLFDRAERVHNVAVQVLTQGKVTTTKPAGNNRGVVVVLLSLLTKACKTFRAIQLTCEGGLGQDASVLARQLFETTTAVAFVLQKDVANRAAMYAAYQDQRSLVTLQEAAKIEGLTHLAATDLLVRAEAKVRAWDELLGREVVESSRRHWSGSTLEWAAKEVGLHTAYGTMYRVTSSFAHGGDVTQHFFVRKIDEDTPTLKLAPGGDQIQAVLRSSMELLRIIVGTANEAFGLGEDEIVTAMSAEVRASMSEKGVA